MATGNPFSGKKDGRKYLAAFIRKGATYTVPQDTLLSFYASGYHTAAIELMKIVNNHNADELLYPIGFLFRHHIELKLKQLMYTASMLLGRLELFAESDNLQTLDEARRKRRAKIYGHSLAALWNILEEWFVEVFSYFADSTDEVNVMRQSLGQIKAAIGKFDVLDKTSIAFRYPFDNDPNNPKGIFAQISKATPIIHLGELVDFMQDVADNLEGLSLGLDIWEEHTSDAITLNEEVREYWEDFGREAWGDSYSGLEEEC